MEVSPLAPRNVSNRNREHQPCLSNSPLGNLLPGGFLKSPRSKTPENNLSNRVLVSELVYQHDVGHERLARLCQRRRNLAVQCDRPRQSLSVYRVCVDKIWESCTVRFDISLHDPACFRWPLVRDIQSTNREHMPNISSRPFLPIGRRAVLANRVLQLRISFRGPEGFVKPGKQLLVPPKSRHLPPWTFAETA
jgi:hypothetical protein